MTHEEIIEILHKEQCSCVILSADGSVTICRRRGVIDLLDLFHTQPQLLVGAFIADKVVGKGAAALMVLGGVSSVYADILSRSALKLLSDSGVKDIRYGKIVENIINRAGTDICPVEKLTASYGSAPECLPVIEDFVKHINK